MGCGLWTVLEQFLNPFGPRFLTFVIRKEYGCYTLIPSTRGRKPDRARASVCRAGSRAWSGLADPALLSLVINNFKYFARSFHFISSRLGHFDVSRSIVQVDAGYMYVYFGSGLGPKYAGRIFRPVATTS